MAEEAPPLPPPSQPPPPEEPVATAFASAPSRPAAFLVQNALRPECSVDFPQITEICERLEMQPSELQAAVVVLATALRERRHPLRVKLKALTIANEMLYNPRAVQEFGSVDGLRDSLEVLRQVRGSELGPAMDENVRMLATEIEVKCFHEKLPPSNGTGWTSFTKAMSSDFEKARQMAKKNLQHFSQKAEKHMEKAERVFEKGATKFMQEAENMLVGPGSSAPRDSDGSRGQKPLLTQEEEELQWALRASLEEAQRSRRNENSASGPRERRGKREAEDRKDAKVEDLPQRVLQAQGRAKVAEELLNRQLAVQAKKSKERSQLNERNEALTAMAERLAEDLCQAEAELAKLKQKRHSLEEQLAIALSMQVDEPRLQRRLQELEEKLAQAKREANEELILSSACGSEGPADDQSNPPLQPAEAEVAAKAAEHAELEIGAEASNPLAQPAEAEVVAKESELEIGAEAPNPPPQPAEAEVAAKAAEHAELEIGAAASNPLAQPAEAEVVAKESELEIGAEASNPPLQPAEAEVAAKAAEIEIGAEASNPLAQPAEAEVAAKAAELEIGAEACNPLEDSPLDPALNSLGRKVGLTDPGSQEELGGPAATAPEKMVEADDVAS